MGLRQRLRTRARATAKTLLERVIGEGPTPGTSPSDAGPSHSARTAAWPPGVMGDGGFTAAPPPHPVDLAEAGETVTHHADFQVGAWEIEPDLAPAVGAVAESAPTEAAVEPDPMPAKTLAGSVAQQEWLPMPKDPPPAAVQVDEPPEAHDATPVEAPADESAGHAPVDVPKLSDDRRRELEVQLVDVMKTVFDPEIPVDIYELGLIYDIAVAEDGTADIQMSLTSPNCPAAQSMPSEVELKSAAMDGIRQANVEIVWEPPWGPERMSEAARVELNIDY